jgi:hypothetical protein
MRKICILAVGLFSLAVAAPAAAQTINVPLSFNYAVLTTPGLKDQQTVSPNGPPITATAQFNEETGTFTIAPENFSFPTYSFTTPAPGTLSVALNGPATGGFNPATGGLTMSADFVATITINGLGSCTADSGTQTYSTSLSTVYPGVPFPKTATGPVTGPGAITGGWPNVTSSGPACGIVASYLNGPGGLWISKNVPIPAPALAVSAPKKESGVVGKSKTIAVTVHNTGTLQATTVSLCAAAPKNAGLKGSKCKQIASLAEGAHKVVKFTFKGKHPGKFHIKFTASETGVKSAVTTTVLKDKK